MIGCRQLLLYCCLGLLPVVLVYGKDAPSNSAERFSEHDLDGDGYISLEEYKSFYEQRRAQRPRGGKRHRYRWRTMRFVEIDRNHDGRISEDEMLDALEQRFDRATPGSP